MVSKTNVERIVDTIIRGIEADKFKVGMALPPQRELSKLFGVSVVVIREATKVLEGRGILMGKRGSGVYVLSKEQALLSDDNSPLQSFTFLEICQFARSIWNAASKLSVLNASDEDILDLIQLNKEMIQSYKAQYTSQHQRLIYESSFGMRICSMSNNQLFYEFMSRLLRATIDIDLIVISENDYSDILEIDKKLLEALQSRDMSRVMLWSSERDLLIDKFINRHPDLLNKRYVFSFHSFRNLEEISKKT